MKPTHFEAKNVNVMLDADSDDNTTYLTIWNTHGDILGSVKILPPKTVTTVNPEYWDVVK
jgi:hypothetical protein